MTERSSTRVGPTAVHVATCHICKELVRIRVPQAGYMAWREGTKIQDALPTLTADEREFLMTRICGLCFDLITKEPDSRLFDDVDDASLEEEPS